ncbi:MAG: hypothetical protein R3F53_07210 [Gammaproteobacteria bacterium]
MARYWLISGRRQRSENGVDCPRHFQIMGKTVLEHSLDRLLSLPLVAGGVLVLAPDDRHWESLTTARTNLYGWPGGTAQSVF